MIAAAFRKTATVVFPAHFWTHSVGDV